jgi:hypothetical protein
VLILLEGPDGAGKSTLARAIARKLQASEPTALVQLMASGPPRFHPLVEYEARLFDYRPLEGRHVIADRWHLGERIYPKILGRDSMYDDAMFWHTELFLQSRGALLVHVTTADVETLERRVSERGDDLVKVTQLGGISLKFWDVVTSSILHKRHFVTSDTRDVHESQHNVDALIRTARVLEQRHDPLSRFVRYVGPTRPDLLLLGDKVNPNAKGLQHNPPAFMPYRSTSGHYLLDALLTHPAVGRYLIGLGNACDEDDTRRLWSTLGKPKTVTLGREAWASVNFPTARHVGHPQWVRRFHHEEQAMYASHIIDGMEPTWKHT